MCHVWMFDHMVQWRHTAQLQWRHWLTTASSPSCVTAVTWPEAEKRRWRMTGSAAAAVVVVVVQSLAWCSNVAISGTSSTASALKWSSPSQAGSYGPVLILGAGRIVGADQNTVWILGADHTVHEFSKRSHGLYIAHGSFETQSENSDHLRHSHVIV